MRNVWFLLLCVQEWTGTRWHEDPVQVPHHLTVPQTLWTRGEELGVHKGRRKWIAEGSMGIHWGCNKRKEQVYAGSLPLNVATSMLCCARLHQIRCTLCLWCPWGQMYMNICVFVPLIINSNLNKLMIISLLIVFYSLSWPAGTLRWGQRSQGICCTMGGNSRVNLFPSWSVGNNEKCC